MHRMMGYLQAVGGVMHRMMAYLQADEGIMYRMIGYLQADGASKANASLKTPQHG